jgi:hypothetical protein
MGMDGNWLEKLAAPYLAVLDPTHVAMVRAALGQLELVRREQVIMMMPPAFCN